MIGRSMSEIHERKPGPSAGRSSKLDKKVRRRLTAAAVVVGVVAVAGGVSVFWLGLNATKLSSDLNYSRGLLPQLRSEIVRDDVTAATKTVEDLQARTARARETVKDPLWTLAASIPWIGANFQAATEVATAADDVARLAAAPLVSVYQSLDWKALTPSNAVADLSPLISARPKLASAAHAVAQSSDRLNSINASRLLPQVSIPLIEGREQLSSMRSGLEAAADVASIAPDMMGSQTPRRYLLLIQNNAETRATGGIPGALAVVTVDKGQVTLGSQTTATAVGPFNPPVAVGQEQQQIYSTRLGKFMQDVNLTPDFPTTAATAHAMWERKTGDRLDGVISIDPVALGYVLEATGPVELRDPRVLALAESGLPAVLNGENVVPALLSNVYSEITEPALQDVYFAGVAQEIFAALSNGSGDPKALVGGLTKGAEERRVLLWSSVRAEQNVISTYPVGGSISGESVSPSQFGVYFNDATGAKMDYYVKRTVQLVEECTPDEYEQIRVLVTSTNTAPADAATTLPDYVTGAGVFGVPPGTVRTNIVAYGPAQANVETAVQDGNRIPFGAQIHAGRPVGTVTTVLAPGQSSTVELTFGKIVQHTEPELVVTPTVQAVNDVALKTRRTTCGPSS